MYETPSQIDRYPCMYLCMKRHRKLIDRYISFGLDLPRKSIQTYSTKVWRIGTYLIMDSYVMKRRKWVKENTPGMVHNKNSRRISKPVVPAYIEPHTIQRPQQKVPNDRTSTWTQKGLQMMYWFCSAGEVHWPATSKREREWKTISKQVQKMQNFVFTKSGQVFLPLLLLLLRFIPFALFYKD